MDLDRLEALLDAGTKRSAIAMELGVSPSTVSRHARRLGHPPLRSPGSRFDWRAIQAFHDLGHSLGACCERFSLSKGAWDSAVSRGDLIVRAVPQRNPGDTRRAVERLLRMDKSYAEIARELQLSRATISYHARQLGRTADTRFSRRIDWASVQRLYDADVSLDDCRQAFGFARASWSAAVKRGDIVPRPRAMPLEELLGGERNRTHLKARLLALGLKEPSCEACGIATWRDRPLTLALHHVNGIRDDNRLANLQLLCPNCHSQTENFAGRNRGRPVQPADEHGDVLATADGGGLPDSS